MTTSQSPKLHWTRFIPRQFSLRALMMVITIVPVFIWWYIQLPAGMISEKQAEQILFEMTRDEVRDAIGAPQSVRKGAWIYEVVDSTAYAKDKTMLVVIFEGDQMLTMYRAPESVLVPADVAK